MQASQLRLGGTWRGQSYYADSSGNFLTPDFDPTGSDITVRVNNASSALTATIAKRSASIYELTFTPGTSVNVGDTVEILLNYTRSSVVETETFNILVVEAGASTSTRYSAIQAASGTSITLDASASATNNIYSNQLLKIGSEVRMITSYVGSTKVATISHAFVGTVTAGLAYEVIAVGPADVQLWRAGIPAALTSTFVNVTVAAMQSNVLGSAAIATGAFDTLKFTTNAINQFASNMSDAWQAGSYSFGGVNSAIATATKAQILSPGSSPIVSNGTGGVTVGAMQADTITSTALATSAVNEIQSGLLLSANTPANFASMAITAGTGQVTIGTNNDKTNYQLAANQDIRNVTGSLSGADAISAAAISAAAVTKLQVGLATDANATANRDSVLHELQSIQASQFPVEEVE